MTKPAIHILLPSLFEPLPLWKSDFNFFADSMLVASLFSHSQSEPLPITGLENTLFHLIGHPTGKELPIAYYRYQLDFGKIAEKKHVICADPVHMQTGIDQILLHPVAWDVICPKEAEQLIRQLNLHFAQDPFYFEACEQQIGHWYLLYDEAALHDVPLTTPLSEVLNSDVSGSLPQSAALQWHQLLNELQMLLHPSNLEDTEKNAGDLPINSVWLWGSGNSYPQQIDHGIRSIIGNTTMSATAALAANCRHQPLPETLPSTWQGNHILLLDDLLLAAAQDQSILWQQLLDALSEQYLRPLFQQWKEKKIELYLYPCDGRRFHVRGRHFWEAFNKVPSNLLNLVAKH